MPKFDANLTFLFNELPFLDRFAAARKAGFLGVEYMSPYEVTKAEIAARLKDNGLTQVLFNLPVGDWSKGERGVAILRRREGDRLCRRARL
jgi:hydroxypyruvate isomerase